MASPADSKVIAYIADISDVKAKLTQLTTLNSKLGVNIGKDLSTNFKKVGDSIGQIKTTEFRSGLQGLANTSTQTSQAMKGLDGSLINVTKTTSINAQGIAKTTTAYKDLSTNTVGLGENMMRLVKRAALTIPLWLVLRGAVMGVISVFKNGLQAIYDQDKAFQKARRNISATSADAKELAKNYSALREEAVKLSFSSGRSVTEITNAYQRFATTGFDAAASMAGMQGSIKLAVLQQDDGVTTATAFAKALRVLVDTSDTAVPVTEQMNEAFALADELWKTNSFDVQEYTANLLKFSSTARGVNLSMKDMLVLFATTGTAGVGARAGNLLRTTILKALQDIDKITRVLDMNFDKRTQSTMDFVVEFTSKLKELNTADAIPYELAGVLGELFNVRGTEIGLALTTMNEKLRENVAMKGDVDKFNESYKEQTETIGVLVERQRQLNTEIGKSLVQEFFGGEKRHRNAQKAIVDFTEQWLTDMSAGVTRAETFGAALETLARTAAFLPSLLAPLTTGGKMGFIDPFAGFTNLKIRQFDRAAQQVNKLGDDIAAGLQGKLSKIQLTDLLKDFTVKLTKNNIELHPVAMARLEGQLQEQLQKTVDKVIVKGKKPLDDYKATAPEQLEISKMILDVELAKFKAIGASNSQLLIAKGILAEKFNIENETIDKISRQLELERELSQEKRLQSELGSESLKLFRIAQTSGVDIAKQIGNVLSGVTSFDTFMRADTFADAAEVFKTEFADVFEQQQAKRFFQGLTIPGLEDLRGGYGIGIQEEAIRSRGFSALPAQLMQERAETQFKHFERDKPIVVNAPVSSNINVDISKLAELEQEFLAKVSAELPRLGTELNSALQLAMKNTLVGKQSPTV